MKKKKEDIHRMGKYCGYDLLPDGSIRIAPQYATQLSDARTEQIAIENTLRILTDQCFQLQKGATKRQGALWDTIIDDYGLDTTLNEYSHKGGILTVKAIPQEPTKRVKR